MQQTQIQHSVYHTSAEIAAAAHAFPFFAQGENTSCDWIRKAKLEMTGKTKPEQYRIVKTYWTHYFPNYTPQEGAALYFDNFAAFPPDRFKRSPRQERIKAENLMKPGEWGHRLYSRLPEPYFYSLSMKNLELPASYNDSRFVYYTVIIEEIKARLKEKIPEPFAWKIEVGEAGNVHVHVIGPYAPALDYLMGSKRAKSVKTGTEVTVLAYLLKPVAPWTAGNYGIYLQARVENQGSRLSPLSGQFGLGNSRSA